MMTAADLYWAHMEAQGNMDVARVFTALGSELRLQYEEDASTATAQGWTKKTAVEVLEGRRKTVVDRRRHIHAFPVDGGPAVTLEDGDMLLIPGDPGYEEARRRADHKNFGQLAYEARWSRLGLRSWSWREMPDEEQGDWERAALAARAAGQNPEDRAERQLKYHQLLTEIEAKLKRIRQLACGSGGR